LTYTIQNIAGIIGGRAVLNNSSSNSIEHLLLDSRKVYSPGTSLFIALKGARRDGHLFIKDLYGKGVRNFIISEAIPVNEFTDANFIAVDDTLTALQQIAAHHRKQFSAPVIGITGSNGKTIVKEWLSQLLHGEFNIVRSPKSYNSQIGVPLSVWQMNERHTLGIFEAGISQPGEMEKLQSIILPTIGVLTNIGEAHSEGFSSANEKLKEKLKLFTNTDIIIACNDNEEINKGLTATGRKLFTWGKRKRADIEIIAVKKQIHHTEINLLYKSQTLSFNIPFTDDASIENAVSCCSVLFYLNMPFEKITAGMNLLQPVNMRLELKKGINNCSVINDSYSADLSSLHIALSFLHNQSAGSKKAVILSDFLQSGLAEDELYRQIAVSLLQHEVNTVIGIGEKISNHLPAALSSASVEQLYFTNTESFIQHYRFSQLKDETILVKGARVFEFEKIVRLLELKAHQTVLEINLTAIAHNLKQYRQLLKPATKIMAMVKAFAYGSGGAEIAGLMQYHKADYLGVAYADEGVELRKAGITLPVMVMNPEINTFDVITEYNLEPEIYSFELLKELDNHLKQEGITEYPIHIEIETGMNRLGFNTEETEELIDFLKTTSSFKVQSVFTHLAAGEEIAQDEFTLQQAEKFKLAASKLKNALGYFFLCHISNSAAVLRHPKLQMDMVRLGIGLYGIDAGNSGKLDLQTVATLKSTVAQLKKLKTGDTVSYNRKGIIGKDTLIATVRIGYADGFSRRLGNGVGKIFVKNKLVPVIGTVCMDMVMIDVTEIDGIKEGDNVIIFGKELPVQLVAAWAGTIPYEIMTGISQRVKRVYYEE
jgi:Alr-MurF fusion protein